jgi:hypothetical protein
MDVPSASVNPSRALAAGERPAPRPLPAMRPKWAGRGQGDQLEQRKALLPRQRQAIEALLSQPSVRAAASAAHVGYRTLRRWLIDDRRFQEELSRLEHIALQQTLFRLSAATGEALSITRYAMFHPDSDMGTRLQAADMLLGFVNPLRESEIERQLVEVEQLLRDIKERRDEKS